MSHIGKHIYKPQLVVLKYKSVVVCYRGSVYAKYVQVHAHLKKNTKIQYVHIKFISNKSISRKKIFLPNSIFRNFENGQKSIFELGNSLKLPKIQFQPKKGFI